MSCAKTAEPIEMQSEMLSRVIPRYMYYMGMYRCPTGMGTFGVSGRLNKSIVKYRIFGVR